MRKLELYLDESGSFRDKASKYIIIGGLLFETKSKKELDKKLIPIHSNICKELSLDELHGCKNKKIFDYLCAPLGSEKLLKIVVIAVNKTTERKINKNIPYNKKYEMAIECLLKRMKMENFIKNGDGIHIYIDRINLSVRDSKAYAKLLSKRLNCKVSIDEKDSKESIYIQFSDIIVNRFSKKDHISQKDHELVMSHPWICSYDFGKLHEYIDVDIKY